MRSISRSMQLERHGLGDDGFAPGRFFGELGDVEIAVMRHQKRARDRRRRHHEHVGGAIRAFSLKRQALVHAEAVLFVDDREGQILEHDVGLKKRVRADQDVDLARRQPL